MPKRRVFFFVIVALFLLVILIKAFNSNHSSDKTRIQESSIAIFQGSNNNPKYLIRPIAVTTDSKGNIYVIDRHSVNGFVKKFDSKGKFLKNFAALGLGKEQLETPTQLAADKQDNLYVTDAGGVSGLIRKRRVQKYSDQGKFQKTLVNFPLIASQAGYYGPAGIAIHQDNVYLTNVDRLEKINLQGKIVQEIGVNNQGLFGFFLSSNYIYGPESLSVDEKGNIYVLDTYSGFIRVFSSQGRQLKQIEPRVVEVTEPLKGDLQIHGNYLYFLDNSLGTLSKLSLDGKKIWQVGTKGTRKDQFLNPTDLFIDKSGYIYIADSGNRCIKQLDEKGRVLKEIGKPPASVVFFSQPGEVASDKKGNVYITDTGNNRVLKLDAQGEILMTIRGENSARSVLGDNRGKLFYPSGLALDSKNNIYIVDYDYNRKQKFSPQGKLITSFGPPGDIVIDRKDNIYLGNGTYVIKLNSQLKKIMQSENAQQESLYNHGNLVVDRRGRIYMIDTINNVIKKFSASGKLLTTFSKAGSREGELLYPNGIALGTDNNIYVADSGNHRIEVFNPNGKFVRTIGRFGSKKGEFNFPQGIDVDKEGNLYIADTDNSRIVKIDKGATGK